MAWCFDWTMIPKDIMFQILLFHKNPFQLKLVCKFWHGIICILENNENFYRNILLLPLSIISKDDFYHRVCFLNAFFAPDTKKLNQYYIPLDKSIENNKHSFHYYRKIFTHVDSKYTSEWVVFHSPGEYHFWQFKTEPKHLLTIEVDSWYDDKKPKAGQFMLNPTHNCFFVGQNMVFLWEREPAYESFHSLIRKDHRFKNPFKCINYENGELKVSNIKIKTESTIQLLKFKKIDYHQGLFFAQIDNEFYIKILDLRNFKDDYVIDNLIRIPFVEESILKRMLNNYHNIIEVTFKYHSYASLKYVCLCFHLYQKTSEIKKHLLVKCEISNLHIKIVEPKNVINSSHSLICFAKGECYAFYFTFQFKNGSMDFSSRKIEIVKPFDQNFVSSQFSFNTLQITEDRIKIKFNQDKQCFQLRFKRKEENSFIQPTIEMRL